MTNCEQWKGKSHMVDINYAVKLDKYLESYGQYELGLYINDRTAGMAAL